MSKAVSFRLPDELAERLRAYCEETGVPQTRVVEDGLRLELLRRSGALDAPVKRPKPGSEEIMAALAAGTALRCPASNCDFTATSPAAKCPVHGRTVR